MHQFKSSLSPWLSLYFSARLQNEFRNIPRHAKCGGWMQKEDTFIVSSRNQKKAHKPTSSSTFQTSFRKSRSTVSLGIYRILVSNTLQLAHSISWVHLKHDSFVLFPNTRSTFEDNLFSFSRQSYILSFFN